MSVKVLWKCFSSYDISVVYVTPIWYNDILRMYLKPEWYTKGTSVVADLLDEYCTFLSLEEFQNKCQIKNNFQGYAYGGTILINLDNR